MKRRTFLKNMGVALGAPIALNGLGLSALAKSALFAALDEESDRVLVLVQLNGGNDGLNTFIPLDQYGNLFSARPHVLIPEAKILSVTDTMGFHPSIPGLRNLFLEGKMTIIQDVGYPNQNRSHFRSQEIWAAGSPADQFWNTGWIGRLLDNKYPGFPINYPNADHPDPFAISMGYLVSETCQGQAGNFAITLADPFALTNLAEWQTTEYAGTQFGLELEFVRESITHTNQYSQRVHAAANAGANLASYPDTDLAQQLKNVALLISGGLKSRIYTVTLGGFDTHSSQVVAGNPLAGKHAVLLQTLSGAIKAFQDDLAAQGLEERVLGMTFSEFGRQIRSNGSYGTDHGTAAPLILFGSCAKPLIIGQNPDIPEEVEIQEGVPMQFDFRDVYGSVLHEWFGMPKTAVKNILHENFQHIPVTTCPIPEVHDDNNDETQGEIVAQTHSQESGDGAELYNYPNPFSGHTTIYLKLPRSGAARLSALDAKGQEISVLFEKNLSAGSHEIPFNGASLPPGNYYLHLRFEGGRKTRRIVKI
jgi:uncharacterized protein (DUF1501 family)